MSKENCMFQYATRHRVIANTGLITSDHALELFNKNRADFIKRLSNDESPEMVIWINCNNDSHYSDSSHYWDNSLVVIDGNLYERVY